MGMGLAGGGRARLAPKRRPVRATRMTGRLGGVSGSRTGRPGGPHHCTAHVAGRVLRRQDLLLGAKSAGPVLGQAQGSATRARHEKHGVAFRRRPGADGQRPGVTQ